MTLISYLFLSSQQQDDVQRAWEDFACDRGVENPPPLQFMTFSRLARQWDRLAWYEQPGGGWIWADPDQWDLVQAMEAFFMREDAPVDIVCKEVRDGRVFKTEWLVQPDADWPGWQKEGGRV